MTETEIIKMAYEQFLEYLKIEKNVLITLFSKEDFEKMVSVTLSKINEINEV